MRRTVSARLELDVAGPAELLLCIAVAHGAYRVNDRLVVTQDGGERSVQETPMRHGTRLHRLSVGAGRVSVRYDATVEGRDAAAEIVPGDLVEYLRPSRYAESDKLLAVAQDQFGAFEGVEQLRAVEAWAYSRLSYVAGSSDSTDGAIDTLLTRCGVCRDYAHLVIGILRALAIPARLVACYAPGLSPMDFHAIVEAHHDGHWYAFDATRLAPRSTFLRIATGRDAADTSFLTNYGGPVAIAEMEVTATSDGDLPIDDGTLIEMG